jgi:predicted ribosome quality control (RQC) complex YloA/Tae2 family protein
VSGSHGIIKNNSSKYPPKHIIEEAAEICAYFSQSRNAKYVPVIYTFKKNVTKPKGAAKGAVRVNKEEVILVSPKSGINEK